MGASAMQSPEKQILPIVPPYSDLAGVIKWAQDLTRTLQTNLSTIARKANDTSTQPLTADLDAANHNIINVANFSMTGNLSNTYAAATNVVMAFVNSVGAGAFLVGSGGNTRIYFDTLHSFVLTKETIANITNKTFATGLDVWTLSNAGLVTQTGPLDISNAAAGQIVFPATQNASAGANTLDDYEEGTWTPVVTAQTGTFTTTSASGSYTKVGRLVSVRLNVLITTVGTAAGYVVVTLPFTSASGGQLWVLAGRENNVTGKMLQGSINGAGNLAVIFYYDNTSPIVANASLHISGDYWV